jgi:signal peptidase I
LARWFDSWMRLFGMAVVLFLFIRTFLLEAFQIPSGSMERTLLAGDFLFVNKAVYGAQIPGIGTRLPAFSTPHRGDVIVFSYPKDPTLNYVKRVVGVGGDTLAMRSGRLFVNGERQVEPYVLRTDSLHAMKRRILPGSEITSRPHRRRAGTIARRATRGDQSSCRQGSTSCWGTIATTPWIRAFGASWIRRRSRDGHCSCISATIAPRRRGCRG